MVKSRMFSFLALVPSLAFAVVSTAAKSGTTSGAQAAQYARSITDISAIEIIQSKLMAKQLINFNLLITTINQLDESVAKNSSGLSTAGGILANGAKEVRDGKVKLSVLAIALQKRMVADQKQYNLNSSILRSSKQTQKPDFGERVSSLEANQATLMRKQLSTLLELKTLVLKLNDLVSKNTANLSGGLVPGGAIISARTLQDSQTTFSLQYFSIEKAAMEDQKTYEANMAILASLR